MGTTLPRPPEAREYECLLLHLFILWTKYFTLSMRVQIISVSNVPKWFRVIFGLWMLNFAICLLKLRVSQVI